VKDVLQAYLKRLTNLSGNNRSLLLHRLIKEQFMDLNDLAYLDGQPAWRIMDEVLSRKSEVKLAPFSDPRDPNSNKKALRLKRLFQKEEFIFQESGARDLYIGWPFVTGKFNDDTLVRAPLCFFPVSLNQAENHWVLQTKNEVNISFNKSLLLAFSHFNQIDIPQELVEFTFDDFERDGTSFRNLLYETLSNSVLKLRFSRSFYADDLSEFKPSNRKMLEESFDTGQLEVSMEAVLGIFPQADSYLVPDYDKMIEDDRWQDLDAFFSDKGFNTEPAKAKVDLSHHFLNRLKEEESYTPLAIDAHQENALNAVKKGNSLVVQGPPGTGKSQLIGNLVADFIARGKKVLVVSQKRAALDVVYQRLKEIELQDFLALVHDFKADRAEVYQKLARQIDRIQDYSRSNANLDSVQLDRKFIKASHAIEAAVEELDEYKEALFSDKECGLSVKELYLTSDPEQEYLINLTQEYAGFDFNDIEGFLKKLRLYIQYAKQLDKEGHPWSERVSFHSFSVKDLNSILQVLDDIPKEAKRLVNGIAQIVTEKATYQDVRTISENLDKLKEFNSFLKNKDIYALFKPMVPFPKKEVELLWLKNSRLLINSCYEGEGVEQHLASSDIGDIQLLLKQRLDAKGSVLKSLRWNFSKQKTRLARLLVANQLRDDKEGLQKLTIRLDNRINLEHQLTKLRSVGWIKETPLSADQSVLNHWLDQLAMAIEAKQRFSSFANFREYFNLHQLTAKELREKISSIHDLLLDLPKKRSLWNKYVLPRQIDLLLIDEDYRKGLKRSLKKDFDLLCELDQLKAKCSDEERSVLKKIDSFLSLASKDILYLFDNSLRLAWIDHMENKYPILRAVSTLKFDSLVSDLQEALVSKQEASQQILLQRVREMTYEDIEFNRLNNRVTYRDLEHQVNKKRQLWPLRRILSSFNEEVFKLLPCWLASPETVSTLFPLEALFDLVIFDEASQCFAEKGLPAICRGRQVVIAGDEKQLKPFDLYRVNWEDQTEKMALEVDSLLGLAQKYLMQVQLKGHYRSQSLDLIQFSNQHFYDNKLKMLPSFQRVNENEPAITYRRVEGIWHEQSNLVEAQEVLRIVQSEQRSKRNLSIGIVTFNAKQQLLISDLLDKELKEVPENLFVKNIENVQGDERDLIIFSVAYAHDINGQLRAQFGSLNQLGGENRLNVAITRARKKVVLVTSIEPEALQVRDSKHLGPKLLKSYLTYAFRVSNKEWSFPKDEKAQRGTDWYLKNKIQDWEKDLPVKFSNESIYADVAVKRRGKFIAVLRTDDDQFYQSVSSKEMFAYEPALYESKGWPYRLIHSRRFWAQKKAMKEKLVQFLEGQLV
jgi:hypothetical protein